MKQPPLQSVLDKDLEAYGLGLPEPRKHEVKFKVNLCKIPQWWHKLFRREVRECDLDKKIAKASREDAAWRDLVE